jgi:hypothetical protein
MTKPVTIVEFNALCERLCHSKALSGYDVPGEPREGERIAHSILDIDESCQRIRDQIVPRLLNATLDEAGIDDALHDLREEYRHILYHLREPRFFDVIF